jgi:transcriptional regulator with XRE-family HTH domain
MSTGFDPCYKKKIGLAIRRARRAQNMTQADLKDRLGVSTNSISGWERGDTAPSMENLRSLCEILNVEPNLLLGMGERGRRNGNENALREPVKALGLRAGELRQAAENSLPSLIDGLQRLESEAREIRETLA